MRNGTLALGIGSNLGNRLDNLRRALAEIKKSSAFQVLTVSPIYESDPLLPEKASFEWNKKFLNAVVLCNFSSEMHPEELLSKIKDIEGRLGRVNAERWAPRIIDVDILFWDLENVSSDILNIPHSRLYDRPFALLPLLDVWPGLKIEKPAWAEAWQEVRPYNTLKSREFFWPKMVGILNVTKDSFSDGDECSTLEKLQQKVFQLIGQGVEIIEVGAESTRPGATPVQTDDELSSLTWALDGIEGIRSAQQFSISLDCRKPEVVEALLGRYDIEYVNDVSGFSDIKMRSLLKKEKKKAFVMHSLSIPPVADKILDTNLNPCLQLSQWWKSKSEEMKSSGIEDGDFIFDPGIGFGKSKWQSLFILQHLDQFRNIFHEIMIGHSRKSFQTIFSDNPASARDLETALITKDLNMAFVQYLRVHDIRSQKIAMRAKY